MRNHFFVVLLVAVVLGLVLSETTVVPGTGPADTCDKCCQGYPGHNGINGQNGLPGRDGLRGNPGGKGERGEAGTPGPAGLAGLPGQRGPVGERGEAGPRGFPGKIGPDGVRGLPGTSGRDGTPGSEGLKGQKGDIGMASARSAFTVLRSADQTASVRHQSLDFTIIQTNVGNDFDIDTDRFTCQIPGVYVFTYHAETNSPYVEIVLLLNGNVVTSAVAKESLSHVAGSVVLTLEEGDQVWLRFDEAQESIRCYNYRGCSFSGFLLYEN